MPKGVVGIGQPFGQGSGHLHEYRWVLIGRQLQISIRQDKALSWRSCPYGRNSTILRKKSQFTKHLAGLDGTDPDGCSGLAYQDFKLAFNQKVNVVVSLVFPNYCLSRFKSGQAEKVGQGKQQFSR